MKSWSAGISPQWERASPDAAGIAPDLPARLDQGVKSGALSNLHAVIVARRGKLVVESYFTGHDERWGAPLGTVVFNAESLHDIRSVSKSIVGLLYGIALEDNRVPELSTPILDAFPAYADLAQDDRRRRIRISHALSMTMGVEWNEDLPYNDPRNSEIAMERSVDRYRYILERPSVAPPGEKWRYSGGATAILGHLIAKGTGQPLLDFARGRLFSPLGIEKVEWTRWPEAGRHSSTGTGVCHLHGQLSSCRSTQDAVCNSEPDPRILEMSVWLAALCVDHSGLI